MKMRTLKFSKSSYIAVLVGVVNSSLVYSQAVNPETFGQNYWYMNTIISDPSFHTNITKPAGVRHVRIGGIYFNQDLAIANYVSEVGNYAANLSSNGLSALVTMPYGSKTKGNDGLYNPPTLTNIASGLSGLEYWCIGNEPDGQGFTNQETSTLVKNIAPIIRGQISGAKILAPELTWFDPAKVTFFESDGMFSEIDFFSFHYYPFGDEGKFEEHILRPTRDNVIKALTVDNLPVNFGFTGTSLATKITNYQSVASRPRLALRK